MSMATDSSHGVIMGKMFEHSSALIFDWIFFTLAGNENIHINISDEFKIWLDRPMTADRAALERLEKSP